MSDIRFTFDLEKADHGVFLQPPAAVLSKLCDSARGDVFRLALPSSSTRASLMTEASATRSSEIQPCELKTSEPNALPVKQGSRVGRWLARS